MEWLDLSHLFYHKKKNSPAVFLPKEKWRFAQDNLEGWVTTLGNAGTIYAEALAVER